MFNDQAPVSPQNLWCIASMPSWFGLCHVVVGSYMAHLPWRHSALIIEQQSEMWHFERRYLQYSWTSCKDLETKQDTIISRLWMPRPSMHSHFTTIAMPKWPRMLCSQLASSPVAAEARWRSYRHCEASPWWSQIWEKGTQNSSDLGMVGTDEEECAYVQALVEYLLLTEVQNFHDRNNNSLIISNNSLFMPILSYYYNIHI